MIAGIENGWLFLGLLPVVAFLYSSVGHGGASGYLALMALFAFPVVFMRPSALLLNIFVAGISFFYFWKNRHFRWKLFYPFAITSIPASFFGGILNVNPIFYKQVLGVLLILAVLRLLGFFGKGNKKNARRLNIYIAMVVGGFIGFFSGMIGIGGGIILSPIILLLGWGDLKETAAVSALFIWVNSVAGMTGLLYAGIEIPNVSFLFVLFALVGGALGGYYGSTKIENTKLRYILGVVLAIASVKLLLV